MNWIYIERNPANIDSVATCVNLAQLLYVEETKEGSRLYFVDGNSVDSTSPVEQIRKLIREELLNGIPVDPVDSA